MGIKTSIGLDPPAMATLLTIGGIGALDHGYGRGGTCSSFHLKRHSGSLASGYLICLGDLGFSLFHFAISTAMSLLGTVTPVFERGTGSVVPVAYAR